MLDSNRNTAEHIYLSKFMFPLFSYLRNVAKQTKYHLGIEVDKLTNSIANTISGDSFPTDVHPVAKSDIKNTTKKNGWLFNWTTEFKLTDRQVFKLTIRNNPEIIQGLLSISDYNDHYYLHLIESAPFNLGKHKLYEGVPGNLFAFTCKSSWDKGYQGFVSFTSKTKLIEHYEKTLGATHVGGHKMVIFPQEALKLIKKYFPT
ncbi:hypothetical protein GCM10027043_37560 [Ferruginibacter profundus]